MILTPSRTNDHLIIKILSDVMMDNSKDFYKEFEAIIQQNTEFKVVSFDFYKVNFMDSSGIGSLIRAASYVKNLHSAVTVFNLNKSLYSVFRLSGLDNIIAIYTYEEFIEIYPELK
jgi:anti-anti-sigma factor